MNIKSFFVVKSDPGKLPPRPSEHKSAATASPSKKSSRTALSAFPRGRDEKVLLCCPSFSHDTTTPVSFDALSQEDAATEATIADKNAKKNKISPLRPVEADEQIVGSLFNTAIKDGEPCGDLCSPKFNPELFNVKPYTPKNPPKNSNSFSFSFIADTLQLADDAFGSGLGSRKLINTVLPNFFRVLIYYNPSDLVAAAYILLNKVTAECEGKETGIGEGSIIKMMADHYGKSEKEIKALATKYEDLGMVASLLSSPHQTIISLPDLTIQSLLKGLLDVSDITGKDAFGRKSNIIRRMLSSCGKTSAKFIIRWLQQKLRAGINAITVYHALADAFYLTKPAKDGKPPVGDIRTAGPKPTVTLDEMEKAVRTAANYIPYMDKLISHLMDGDGIDELLENCKIRSGIPIRPMLARAVSTNAEAYELMGGGSHEFTCEYKYDGERVQVHMTEDRAVKMFSRNMENICKRYPDVMGNFLKCVRDDVKDCIIDGEVVPCDQKTGKIRSFQSLMTRKRKMTENDDVKVSVCFFVFDILYLNGKSLLDTPLAERRSLLVKSIKDSKGIVSFASHLNTKSLDELEDFFYQAVSDSCEGLIIKTLEQNSAYEPTKRSSTWLKLKKDYVDGLGDSVDLVPIGAYFGKGKRTNVYGSYLLAVYNPELELFQTTCKTGTGFTETFLKEIHEDLQDHITNSKPPNYDVDPKLTPDVWLNPVKVWECKAADLSLSPSHTAAKELTVEERGIGLRFPRFIRVRDDKQPTDATTTDQIYEMYSRQYN